MPTILRVDGFRVYFWSHEPNEPQPVRLASNAGFVAHDLGVILRLVRQNQPRLLEAWHEFFGTG